MSTSKCKYGTGLPERCRFHISSLRLNAAYFNHAHSSHPLPHVLLLLSHLLARVSRQQAHSSLAPLSHTRTIATSHTTITSNNLSRHRFHLETWRTAERLVRFIRALVFVVTVVLLVTILLDWNFARESEGSIAASVFSVIHLTFSSVSGSGDTGAGDMACSPSSTCALCLVS